jgi:hypothetical protein
MRAIDNNPRSRALWLAALLLAGCAAATVSPTFPTMNGLPRPDRVLVYDFAAAPDALEAKFGLDPQASGGTGADAQTKEDIEVGRALAKALAGNLVSELKTRGIVAVSGSEAAQPGPDTASLRGRFVRTSQRDGSTIVGFGLGVPIRARIVVFQGTSLNSQLVSEAEMTLPSSLKPGLGPNLGATIDTDAKRMAMLIADRFTDYYKRQGWIQ